MKRSIIVVAALVLNAAVVHAADSQWRFSLYVHDITTERTEDSAGLDAGAGASIGYVVNDRLSLSFATAVQSYTAPFTSMEPVSGTVIMAPVTRNKTLQVKPIELNAGYRVPLGRRWATDLLAGLRYVQAPTTGSAFVPMIGGGGGVPIQLGFNMRDRTSTQLGTRIVYELTPRTELQVETWRLLRQDNSPADPLTRTSAGVAWRF
jgi:hypothetical protein